MNIKSLSHKDALWTNQLANIQPSLKQLFILGELPPGPRVGIIGTRRPSAYGRQMTESLAGSLASHGVAIVSGLAIGVDSIAHRAALACGGLTIAVLPGAIQDVYPRRHLALATEISQSGAVLSEYAKGMSIHKSNFIARNRIIAALSDVLVVVEASHKSGTMHTVRFAQDLGITVGAVPGEVGHIYSQGTNQLIKDGAHLIADSQDVLDILGIPGRTTPVESLSNDQIIIRNTLAAGPLHVSEIARQSNLNLSIANSVLSELEIDNKVARRQDGMYALR